jgi:uncharacterized surface anchored protein
MTVRRSAGAGVLVAGLALFLGALTPAAALAPSEDSDSVGVRVDITPLEEPTTDVPTEEPTTTAPPTTEPPTTPEPTDGGVLPTDAETTATPSPTDTSTPGGNLPDTGVDLTAALWITGPLLAVGAALALLAARRRTASMGR